MKCDFRTERDDGKRDEFCTWLRDEVIADLRSNYGDRERTKTALFLFANRACEAHLPDAMIGEIIGVAVARAGYFEREQAAVFDWVELFVETARRVHESD